MSRVFFIGLVQKYVAQKASPAEAELLESYFHHLEAQDGAPVLTDDQLRQLKNESFAQLKDRLFGAPTVRIPKQRSWSWLAAACVAAMLVLSALALYVLRSTADKDDRALGNSSFDALPGSNKATLMLGDGSVIVLDSAGGSNLDVEGKDGIDIIQDGQLVYKADNSNAPVASVPFHFISIPRGGQFKVVLPDGSRVWLNALSSLRFPTQFNGPERRVELKGEGYFEIAKDAAHPFIVNVNGTSVTALGTAFNINAYPDEETEVTTLVEGKVMVTTESVQQILLPGEQLRFNKNSNAARVVRHANVDDVTAWKEGQFEFRNVSLAVIMRQLSRWYDVDVEYQRSDRSQAFSGIINRNTKLSEVLMMLQQGGVHFKLEDKKVIVLP